jgi:mono/diheme cytochrome c family protein
VIQMTRNHGRSVFLAAAAATALFVGALSPLSGQNPPTGSGPAPVPTQVVQPGGRGPVIGNRGGQMAADPANETADYSTKPAVTALSPQDQVKHFILPPGYRLELLLSEPDIVSPAAIAFDGNGRMYVAEMRTFMRDADGTGQFNPISRVSMHESTRRDGTFDKHTVFADGLVLPRMILPLDKGLLINETRSDDVVLFTDTNGDGVADTRKLFYSGVGSNRSGNVQHEQSGLVWGLDNWIYTTYNTFRFRWSPEGILREPTPSAGAEWGLSMDDDGKMWWVNAGGERGPVNFQFPIQYGAFNPADQFEPGFNIVHPAPGVGDMQGGTPRVRMPFNNLNHFTSTNGQEIVRTDRYPEDLRGDLLFGDPVGRLIRRADVVKTEGLTQLRNVYPGAEFITSTDPLFRPLNIKEGPDGALYIVDMYNGIIQDSNWTGRGTYLRTRIEQYGLDKVTNHGRIWRLRFDGIPGTAPASAPTRPGIPAIELLKEWPRMNDETPAQLVAHLSHANGWWRDTAQRLLVLKQDKSVAPALRALATSGTTGTTGRIHALWTLEGLNALDAPLARELMKDANPRVRVQAIRASETLYKAGTRSLDADYRALTRDTDANVAIQAMLTLNVLKVADAADAIRGAQAANSARGVKTIGDFLLTPPAAGRGGRGGAALSTEQQQQMQQGAETYSTLCSTCHGADARGEPLAGAAGAERGAGAPASDGVGGSAGAQPPGSMMMAPALAGSPRVNGHRDYVVKTLLQGLTGPLAGARYSNVMVPMGTNTDAWVASVASYVRTSFGNAGGFVTPADVARVRAATANRRTPWTLPELEATLPRRLEPDSSWKVTASHNSESAATALRMSTWSTGASQAPGMWFQIELPQPVMLAEIEFDSPNVAGRGGGGAARGTPAPPPVVQAPKGYRVEVSLNGTAWGPRPVVEGKGTSTRTSIAFAPVRAKFVRITQTDTVDSPPMWVMGNIRLYEAGTPAR